MSGMTVKRLGHTQSGLCSPTMALYPLSTLLSFFIYQRCRLYCCHEHNIYISAHYCRSIAEKVSELLVPFTCVPVWYMSGIRVGEYPEI